MVIRPEEWSSQLNICRRIAFNTISIICKSHSYTITILARPFKSHRYFEYVLTILCIHYELVYKVPLVLKARIKTMYTLSYDSIKVCKSQLIVFCTLRCCRALCWICRITVFRCSFISFLCLFTDSPTCTLQCYLCQ